jgi:hypothetical protein
LSSWDRSSGWHENVLIYSFIRSNEFIGEKVVLFFTYEGGISYVGVDEWKTLAQRKGGSVVDVVSINRKNFKTPEGLKASINSIIGKDKAVRTGGTK